MTSKKKRRARLRRKKPTRAQVVRRRQAHLQRRILRHLRAPKALYFRHGVLQ